MNILSSGPAGTLRVNKMALPIKVSSKAVSYSCVIERSTIAMELQGFQQVLK